MTGRGEPSLPGAGRDPPDHGGSPPSLGSSPSGRSGFPPERGGSQLERGGSQLERGGSPPERGGSPPERSGSPPERSDPPPARRPVIAVDAMGGDHGPKAIVAGAVAAMRQSGISIVLVGRPGQVRPLLADHGVLGRVRLVAAEDSVAMHEGALASWRRPRSSIAVACQLARLGQATAVVSAGSTGAIVAIARLRLRNLPGVLRPGLAVALPTMPTPTVLVDAGAIADPKPEVIAQFAQFGTAYAEVAFGIANPRVGLLSIGSEPGKGNKLARRAFELLSAEPQHGALPIRFAGNVEGSDLLAGKVDVIVADGFAGNIALKSLEGTAVFAVSELASALRSSRRARLGAALQRRELSELRTRFDPESYGGAVLLGLEGTVVIAHGAARERSAAAACRLAADLTSGRIAARILERLGPQRQGFRRRT